MNKAPWPDFNGNEIHEYDIITHPSGQQGMVKFHANRELDEDKWVINYFDKFESRLCLQIGDKGRAVVTSI